MQWSPLLAFVPWLAWRRRWRELAWLTIGFALPVLIGVLAVGWTPYRDWMAALNTTAATAGLKLNMSLTGVLTRAAHATLFWQGMVIAPIAAVTIWRLKDASVDKGWALLMPALLLCSPVGWTYYASWFWPVWSRWRGSLLEWTAVSLWLVPPQLVTSTHWLFGSPYAIGLLLLFAAQIASDADVT
jgi:hypothetical protein